MATIAAIDQGTTSTRCILFDEARKPIACAQREHQQIHPRPGWVEHDPAEIWRNTQAVIRQAVAEVGADRIVAIGVTNQRETTVFWNRRTGVPCCNAIVWQDTRTQSLCEGYAARWGQDWFRARTGLPVSSYFSAPKIRWATDEIPAVAETAAAGELLCATMESWLIWNLTGGVELTDASNASRTLLMNLRTLEWDDELLVAFDIPRRVLPTIVSNSRAKGYGLTLDTGPFGAAIPICAAAGDQQAALIGQCCFDPADTKVTYGTGCFLLANAGGEPPVSRHGLLSTLAYRVEDAPPVYALEGSVAVGGALVQWLRDKLGILDRADDIEALARTVNDTGDLYMVPAFSGLFAPHWRPDARGVMVGITHQTHGGHLARAALEATCHQVADVVEALVKDLGRPLGALRVDGGMVVNNLLMQLQADLLGVEVMRPANLESTALGAALLAGMAVGVYPEPASLRAGWRPAASWSPTIDGARREGQRRRWRAAVERSLGWVEPGT